MRIVKNKEWKYKISKKQEVQIVNYIGNEEDITIPSQMDGLPAKTIEMYYSTEDRDIQSRIRSVTVSDGITKIKPYAFVNWPSLTKVILPESVVTVGDHVFYHSNQDLKVFCPENVFKQLDLELRDNMVCMWLNGDDDFPENEIEMFKKAIKRSSKKFFLMVFDKEPEVLAKMLECSSPNEEKIDEYIELLNSKDQKNNLSVLLDYKNKHFDLSGADDILGIETASSENVKDMFRISKEDDHIIILKCKSLAPKITIPSLIDGIPVTVIGKNAFKNNEQIVSVNLPDTLEIIEESAFEKCTNLKECILPEGLIRIEKRAFYCCESLELREMNSNLEYVGKNAINDLKNSTIIVNGMKTQFKDWTDAQGYTLYIYAGSKLHELSLSEEFLFNLKQFPDICPEFKMLDQ